MNSAPTKPSSRSKRAGCVATIIPTFLIDDAKTINAVEGGDHDPRGSELGDALEPVLRMH